MVPENAATLLSPIRLGERDTIFCCACSAYLYEILTSSHGSGGSTHHTMNTMNLQLVDVILKRLHEYVLQIYKEGVPAYFLYGC